MTRNKRELCRITGAFMAMVVISLSVLAYLEFAGLKKGLLSALSDRVTAAIGQPVGIDDISFQLPAGITVYGITIGNPRGFAPGKFLEIQKIILHMKLKDLLYRKLHFNKIIVDSPAVTVLKDEKGKLNISDRMRQFFSGGSGAEYRVDALRISSGIFSLNTNERMTVKKIDFVFRNLSSRPKSKTDIKGGLTYAGNRINLEGWAYLKEETRRFGVSVSAKDFSPALFSEDLNQYRVDTKNATLDIDVEAKGDTRKGIEMKSAVRARGIHVVSFPPVGDITLTSNSFFDIGNDALVVRDLSLRAGEVSEARLRGVITDLKRNPACSAVLKIGKFDLGAVNFPSGVRFSGIVTSGDLRLNGRLRSGVPQVSGPLFLSGASVTSAGFAAKRIDAKVIVSSGRELSFSAESTSDIIALEKRRFEKPVRLRLSLHGRGRPGRITISSSAVLVPVVMTFREKIFHAAAIRLDSDGLLENKRFSGHAEVEIKDAVFGGQSAGSFVIRSHADLGKGVLGLKGLSLKNEHVAANAETAQVRTLKGKAGYAIDIEDLNVDYPAGSSGITHLKLSLDLKNRGESLSGSFGLSAGRVEYRNFSGGPLEGSGRFDDKNFQADLHSMKLFGGDFKCVLHGRTEKGFFPLLVNMDAENIDMADLSKTLSKSKSLKMPYDLSGGTGSISFEGTLNSRESLTGKASFRLLSLSASRRDDGRSLLKGGDLAGKVMFAGNDLEFTVDAGVGKVAAHVRGDVKDFMGKSRQARINADVPAVKAADIRASLWDIFPDAFLYAGLDGSLSAALSAGFTGGRLSLDGGVELKNFVLAGENGEYSIGPVNGTIPLTYRQGGKSPDGALPAFDKSEFAGLRRYYENWKATDSFGSITAASLSYGFKLLEDIKVMVKPENGVLNIGKVSANIFGGTLEGSAVIGFSGGLKYRAGFIVDGLSLKKLCDNIGPIRGYISGRVDGVADLKSAGDGTGGLIGKAGFWSYSTKDEKTMISKEFLRKVGGPAVKTYLGDRRFDKGIVDLYIQKGMLIFKDLEISHGNFMGVRDLSIKVAPFNNRIRIADLLWSLTEAAQRAKKE